MKHIITLTLLAALLCACNSKQETNNPSTMNQNDECLICGAPLEYLETADTMECHLCKKRVVSNVRCTEGHFVCDDCHTTGVDSVIFKCQQSTSKNPIEILESMMSMSFCHMHGPEHHVLVGAALLTAYKNAGGEVDLSQALPEMVRRGKEVPGGACGRWGACGAALSAGTFVSIVTHNSPLGKEEWRLSNRCTAEALMRVSEYGGPRCCKRDSYLSILSTVEFVAKNLNVQMEMPTVECTRSKRNNQCLGSNCPFFPSESSL